MEERFVPEGGVSLKVSVHTLQEFHMPTVGDSEDIDLIIQLLPYTYQHLHAQYQRLHAQSFVAALLNRVA